MTSADTHTHTHDSLPQTCRSAASIVIQVNLAYKDFFYIFLAMWLFLPGRGRGVTCNKGALTFKEAP